VSALSFDGQVQWTWDFVREVLKFHGDRWSGEQWLKHKQGRVTWREQFLCSRDMALHGDTLIIPAGGSIVWLQDAGAAPRLVAGYAPNESPATLGLSVDAQGDVYRQWFRRDNNGSIERLRLVDRKPESSFVAGTESNYNTDASMGFSAVSIRDGAVYRCRPEEGVGLCRHSGGETQTLGDYPAIAQPVLAGDKVIVSCLDGRLAVVPLDADQSPWVFQTPHGRPLSSPAAVARGLVVCGGEDGYLYVLGPGQDVADTGPPLDLPRIRSPLSGRYTAAEYNWDTHFANQANTNRTLQELQLPLAMRWIRRCEGTIKHLSTFGGGRVYTHTAEGQIMAVEQETGRLLWRVFYPGVHVSFTTPAYHDERLYVPQAGLRQSRLRCLDAATGRLIWEVPFSGSPSWNRQIPPLIHDGLIFYQFGTGQYTGRTWLFEHQSTFGFPPDQTPLVRAWELETGREVWSRDFSEYGHGGDDAGMCLADGTLYYSCYFGDKASKGVTAALDPKSGAIKWLTTKYSVHAGCAPSVDNGRLYLGGYNAVDGKVNRVWCLDTATGELVWKSDPVERAIHTVTIAGNRLFTHAQYRQGYLLDAGSGQVLCELTQGYRCTRFTMDGDYLLGPNMDVIDTAHDNRLLSSGPAVDVLQCVGAQISNGRLFYTANGSGLQLSMSYGEEASLSTGPCRFDTVSRSTPD
jgi:outer membrane protein assembly factor BamB